MIYVKKESNEIKAFSEQKENTITITEEQWVKSNYGMYCDIINNEFIIIEPIIDLEKLKQEKIQQLKNNCYNYIINKYPLFKQINLVNGVGTLQEKSEYDNFIAIQRSLCNAKEQDILNATTIDKINEINIEFVDE